MSNVILAARLYHTADRQRVVGEDSTDAAFLLASVGDELSAEEAAQYGVSEAGTLIAGDDLKAAAAGDDKAAARSATKAR